MDQHRSKIDFGLVAWLIALSFWSGVSFMQVQANKEMIQDNRNVRVRMWSDIKKIQIDIADIAGYIRAKEQKD